MEGKFLLIRDDCDGDGVSSVCYEEIGTKEGLRKVMREEFASEIGEPAIEYADATVHWDEASLEDDRACMWVQGNDLSSRHISWWMVPVTGRYALVMLDVKDGGGIEVKQLGAFDSELDAIMALGREYRKELEHPTFYAGWDPEYCGHDETSAELTVETMDAAVYLNVIDTSKTELYFGFEYLG